MVLLRFEVFKRDKFTCQYGFHPGERDYGVSTHGEGSSDEFSAIVSIPASGIMVFLRTL